MKRFVPIALFLLLVVAVAAFPAQAEVTDAPQARNDALDALKGVNNSFSAGALFADNGSGADDLGDPAATLSSFGTTTSTDNGPGATVPLAGGNLKVNANGSLTLSNPTATGLFVFFYRISNPQGFSDASVTLDIGEVPAAKRDDYVFPFTVNQIMGGTSGLLADNGFGADNLGVPLGALVSFGGLEAGGGVNSNAAGSSVPFAGGTLTVNGDGGWRLLGAPFEPGLQRFDYRISNERGTSVGRVNFFIQAEPIAANDTIRVQLNGAKEFPNGKLFGDNGNGADVLGYPAATISSFGGGDLGGAITGNAAGAAVPLPGGAFTVTVKANGGMSLTAPSTTGTYTFLYRLSNALGQSDASVTIQVTDPPVAKDDAYSFMLSANQTVNSAAGLFADNGSGADYLGTPAATLFSYGGGALGGSAGDHLASQPVGLAGGTLLVNSDGGWSLCCAPFQHGVYPFNYRLKNNGDTSEATVTLTIKGPPEAEDDALMVQLGVNAVLDEILFKDNGSGSDDRGTPAAPVASFGGGTLPGNESTNAAGSTVSFAGGSLKVDADGTLTISGTTTPGEYAFDYLLANSVDSSKGTVSIMVAEPPEAKDDAYDFLFDAGQTVAAGEGLFADNGGGADNLGMPVAQLVSFGGNSLAGSVEDHAPGDAVSLAGGTLTVNADGSWSLANAPFIPGIYVFSYRIENSLASSDAMVTLTVRAAPTAADDSLDALVQKTTAFPAGTLFADSGSGRDVLGFPIATLVSFGDGGVGGAVTDFAPGTTVPFAGGLLRVDADGSLILTDPQEVGVRLFKYRISNSLGASDATVAVNLSTEPKVFTMWEPVIFR